MQIPTYYNPVFEKEAKPPYVHIYRWCDEYFVSWMSTIGRNFTVHQELLTAEEIGQEMGGN